MRDANDWRARMETVKNTFNARIGQICNAAFDRSIIAYDESRDEAERTRMREETETLEILTGLEIDSAKSGVKPDLSEYLGYKTVSRSDFLRYKSIIKSSETHKWYEATKKQKTDKFFSQVDWDNISANVEKLPYFARMLEKQTPKLKPQPAPDEELFPFAKEKEWQKQLKQSDLNIMQTVIADYEEAHRHIRFSRFATSDMKRRSDVERILFAKGMENDYTADELYGLFASMPAEDVAKARQMLREEQFHLMNKEQRLQFIYSPVFSSAYKIVDYEDLFTDSSHNGYRLLGDIICDYDDRNTAQLKKENAVRKDTNSALLNSIMYSYEKDAGTDYEQIIKRSVLDYIRGRKMSGRTALRCAIALGKRQFVYDVLLNYLELELKEDNDAKRKRRIPRIHR